MTKTYQGRTARPGPIHQDDLLTIAPLATRPGLRIEGEVDISNADELRRALAMLPMPADGVLHLALDGLTFVDVVGIRALLSIIAREPRACVILHDPPRTLTRVIGLLWEEPAGLRSARSTRPCTRRRDVARGVELADSAKPAVYRAVAEAAASAGSLGWRLPEDTARNVKD